MLKTTVLAAAAALALGAGAALAQEAEGGHVTDFAFSFEGPFGRFDQAQLQRGLQVYTEVCSACHGLKFVAYRELAEEGGPAMSEEQMRAYAAMHEVTDPATGETGPATPTNHFQTSPVENAPDLSLMAKARAGFHGPVGLGINQLLHGTGGPEYIASLLVGFTGEERDEAGAVLYENHIFPGGWISMAPPLSDGQVTYADGTEATVDADVAGRGGLPDVGRRAEDDGAQVGRPDRGAVPDLADGAALFHQQEDLVAAQGSRPRLSAARKAYPMRGAGPATARR